MFKIVPEEQILVWNNDELNHIGSLPLNTRNDGAHGKQTSSSLPNLKRSSVITTGITILSDDFLISELNTTENMPLYLINGQMNSKIRSTPSAISSSKFPEMGNVTNTDVDAQYGKLCSSLVYSILRHVDKFVHNYKLACSVPSHML